MKNTHTQNIYLTPISQRWFFLLSNFCFTAFVVIFYSLLPWSGLLFFSFRCFFEQFFYVTRKHVDSSGDEKPMKSKHLISMSSSFTMHERERGKKLSTINRSLESDLFSSEINLKLFNGHKLIFCCGLFGLVCGYTLMGV